MDFSSWRYERSAFRSNGESIVEATNPSMRFHVYPFLEARTETGVLVIVTIITTTLAISRGGAHASNTDSGAWKLRPGPIALELSRRLPDFTASMQPSKQKANDRV